MPDPSTLVLFAAAALALIVVPGPAVLYIVAQSIDRGRLAGIVSALGVAVGGLVHVTAAAIGLSSLLVSSATAFAVVKYAGAAYLLGLGLSVGTVIWFDLRLLGRVLTATPVSEVYRRLSPIMMAGFATMFGSGAVIFTIMRIVVVLPAPFGPSSANISPRRISRLMSLSAASPVA